MELTGSKLEEILNTELVGKDVGYSGYNFTHALLDTIRLLAKKAGLKESDFDYRTYRTQSKNSAYLTYKGVYFGEATFQKQKGKRCRYGGYEWTFKKVAVSLLNEYSYSNYKGLTFEEMLSKIDNNLLAQKSKEEERLEQARQIFKKIKEEIGAKDDYEVRYFIEYMNKNRYSLY
jgi:hypothetical protein